MTPFSREKGKSGLGGVPSENERRRHFRRAYPFIQMLAPYNGKELPRRREFRPVQCQDLSAAGISFILASPPSFEYAVIALGVAPELIYVTVRVTHCNSRPGATDEFLVGCRFLGKVSIGL
ncbi:MAG: PilZ domain-containing protein [Thermoguttaceae bacterium]